MGRVLRIFASLLAACALIAAGVSYSWTFTPIGRLDYGAAVVARMAGWQSQGRPAELTPENRAAQNEMIAGMLSWLEPAPLRRIEDRQITSGDAQIPIRIYTPETKSPDERLPLYLDIHGGGWWLGDGFPFEPVTSNLAAAVPMIVVSVDYRLAPEHPYPAPLDDCYAALVWLHANAESLGGDPDRIAVGGGSAGGNLAAAVALRARDRDGPKLRFQYLMVPATDLSDEADWPSYRETGEDYLLTVSSLRQMAAAYAPTATLRRDPYVSPLFAEDLSGLPPALVATALFDPLRDQGEAYGQRLRDAGVEVQIHREPGALHGFLGSPERAGRVQQMAVDSLRKALY